jgi:hypothetical protein
MQLLLFILYQLSVRHTYTNTAAQFIHLRRSDLHNTNATNTIRLLEMAPTNSLCEKNGSDCEECRRATESSFITGSARWWCSRDIKGCRRCSRRGLECVYRNPSKGFSTTAAPSATTYTATDLYDLELPPLLCPCAKGGACKAPFCHKIASRASPIDMSCDVCRVSFPHLFSFPLSSVCFKGTETNILLLYYQAAGCSTMASPSSKPTGSSITPKYLLPDQLTYPPRGNLFRFGNTYYKFPGNDDHSLGPVSGPNHTCVCVKSFVCMDVKGCTRRSLNDGHCASCFVSPPCRAGLVTWGVTTLVKNSPNAIFP